MITKQGVDIAFAQGLDTKTDRKRVQMGKFELLRNTVFNKGGELQKRNGYPNLTALPNTTYSYLTTFNGNLTAIGKDIAAYNAGAASWVTKGTIEPLSLTTLPVIRNNLNQSASDTVVASNGVACTVYLEQNGGTTTNKYVVYDSVTGQNFIAPSVIPVTSGTVSGGMRVFLFGNFFIIGFTNNISGTNHLQYVSINILMPTTVSVNADIASSYDPAPTEAWDGYVSGNKLYFAYNTSSGGQAVNITYLNSSFILATPVSLATSKATMVSVTADETNPTNPTIYLSYYRLDTQRGSTAAFDSNLNTLLAPVLIIPSGTILNITSAAQDGTVRVFYEVSNNYSGTSVPTHYIEAIDVTLTTIGTPYVVIRSVGLASKAFIVNDVIYFLAVYQSPYQNTYFLINGSTSTSAMPVIAAKLAYEDGGGYLTTGLPGVTVIDDKAWISYLFKDLIQAVNKDTAVTTGTQTAGIYSQTGINLVTFTFNSDGLDTSEIGNDLLISGGFLWMYDGYLPVEQGFFLYPDVDQTTPTNNASWSATGGSIVAKPDGVTNTDAYFYVFTYEWTDNQGNAFRSAPSIPVPVTTTGSGSSGSVTLKVPTLRLTEKVANPVKIVIYRWSVAQQQYYQVTSITSPILNDTTVDTVTYVDTSSDATILGNNLLYTTGGVLENIAPPATDITALFDSRFWMVDSEDRDLLWFSKQVIQSVPVEMSDLLTYYVPPSTATVEKTGPVRSISPMDDKLIIGKENALFYINGTGPDNTGANNQYSQLIFITSTVGCSNQRSIVLIPQGMMFQSNKGIWLLDRGLNPSYIGAPVEDFTKGALVTSAVSVPETNQVRFTLDSGITLMYDYFYDQWGTFYNVPALSSCIYAGLHTFINDLGRVHQESPDSYQDGSSPVLINFKTGPLRLKDLQNYQRVYFFYLLGTYVSPHKLLVKVYYDYEINPSQSLIISPTNYSTPYGSGLSQSPYGQGDPYGGPSLLESWRVFLERQRCMAFAIEVQEIFDPSFDTLPGAGLTLSGLNVVMGFKKDFRPQPNVNSVG